MERGAAEDIIFHKAPLIPSAWIVQCPICGTSVDVDQVREDEAGAFNGDGPDQFPECDCGAHIETVAVFVQEAVHA